MISEKDLYLYCRKLGFTNRETEVMSLLTIKEITASSDLAASLNISESTINVHLSRILTKTKRKSRTELLASINRDVLSKLVTSGSENRLTIIMADDDVTFSEKVNDIITNLFSGAVQFERCCHGQEVLMHLSRSMDDSSEFPVPDLILLDLQILHMDGFRTLEKIRAIESFRSIPVVVFSASSDRDEIEKLYKAGCNAYVIKPKDDVTLKKILEITINYWFRTAEKPTRKE